MEHLTTFDGVRWTPHNIQHRNLTLLLLNWSHYTSNFEVCEYKLSTSRDPCNCSYKAHNSKPNPTPKVNRAKIKTSGTARVLQPVLTTLSWQPVERTEVQHEQREWKKVNSSLKHIKRHLASSYDTSAGKQHELTAINPQCYLSDHQSMLKKEAIQTFAFVERL